MEPSDKLTEQEITFCELYANGEAPYGGDLARCYREVFNDHSATVKTKARKLLTRPEIQEYLKELTAPSYDEAVYMKTFLTENLTGIVRECSTAKFYDRRQREINPASLRSVAVQAAKALMDMHPVKEANKVEIEGKGDQGVIFQVITPEVFKAAQQAGNEGEGK